MPAAVQRRPPVALLLAAALLLGGCTPTGQAQPPAPPPGAERLAATVPVLCEAAARAAQNVPPARGVFFDRAHDDRHELVHLAQIRDHTAATRLSQAAQDLPALTEATRGALTTLCPCPAAMRPAAA